MQKEAVFQRITNVLPDAQIMVEGEDCNFTVTVITGVFSGLRPVTRQQKVMEGFLDVLASGELHALSIRAHTPEEWQALQQPVPLQL